MRVEPCRDWREALGAYVLGQLPEPQLHATRAHLAGCPGCRAEAEALAPLARLLPKADPAQLGSAAAPPARLAERVAARVRGEADQRRRRRRTRTGLALAGTAIAAGLVGVVVTDEGRTPSAGGGEGARTVAFDALPRGVGIAATLRPRPFGTEIRMRVRGVHSGTLCRVFLRSAHGQTMPAGSFRYRYSGREAVLTSALDLSAARAVGIRAYGETFVAPLREANAPPPTITERTS